MDSLIFTESITYFGVPTRIFENSIKIVKWIFLMCRYNMFRIYKQHKLNNNKY